MGAQAGDSPVRVVCLAPDPAEAAFDQQVNVARAQIERGFQAVVLVDRHDVAAATAKLAAGSELPVEIQGADFFQRDHAGAVVARNRLGGILNQVFAAAPKETLLCFLAPNETIFANHVGMLAAALRNEPEMDYAWSKAIRRDADDQGEPRFAVETKLDLLSRDSAAPIGLGRFMFRADRFATARTYLLESLDCRVASGLAVHGIGCPTRRASLVVDTTSKHHLGIRVDATAERNLHVELRHDLEAIRDLDPARFDVLDANAALRDDIQSNLEVPRPVVAGPDPNAPLMPDSLYLDRLSRANRRVIILQLLPGLPVPRVLRRIFRECFRLLRSMVNFARGVRDDK